MPRALAINCGSSSIKVGVFEKSANVEQLLERRNVAVTEDHGRTLHAVLEDLEARGLRPDVIGHRIVHGGPKLVQPTRVDAQLLELLDTVVPFAPLHLPDELAAIRVVQERWPTVPQVVCFDTAFHHDLPEVARHYALPTALWDRGIRRYGFHGLSYEYIVSVLGDELRPRTVIAHLGSGASMVALRDGQPIDTTMGLTPTGGLVMGTRPGDLDPGLILHLLRQGRTVDELERMFQDDSGLRALSERTSDVRQLLALRATDVRAALAIDVFCASARKAIGALAAAIGGIDALVFTGGIGENAAEIRVEIARGLAHLGIVLADAPTPSNKGISIGIGVCDVRVIPTDEERIVARHAFAVVYR